MKTIFRPVALFFFGATLFFSSCKDDPETIAEPTGEPTAEAKPGTLNLHFDSRRSQSEDFVVNKMYLNANNDSVSLATFKYFISNVSLVKEDGSTYAEPNSYHLIQAGNTADNEQFKLINIPPGVYTKIRFSVGVDATQNTSTAAQVGDLPNDHDMTWDWNTGYIFMYANGKYYKPGSNPYPSYLYTIGKNQNFRTVELAFPAENAKTQIDDSHNPKMHLHANIFDIFGNGSGTQKIDVKLFPIIQGDPQYNAVSEKIANNYAQMFRIDHIHTH